MNTDTHTIQPTAEHSVEPLHKSVRHPVTFDRSKKIMAGFAIAFFTVIGLGILVVNSQQSQDQRTQADVIDGASLYFLPQQVTLQSGTTSSVSLLIDPKQYEATAADIRLQYDPSLIEVVSVTQGQYFPLELRPSSVNGTEGLVLSTLGHRPGEVLRVLSAPVLTIEFRALAGGESMITVLSDSVVTALDINEDILTDLGSLTITAQGGRGGDVSASPTSNPTRPSPTLSPRQQQNQLNQQSETQFQDERIEITAEDAIILPKPPEETIPPRFLQ